MPPQHTPTIPSPPPGGSTVRRRRGEPRRLLLEAARDLFSRQGFSNTSTREITELAGVSEPLLFRQFGSKVGLFREALVGPFVDFVEDFRGKWESGTAALLGDAAVTRQFVGELYDLFQLNRGLVLTFMESDAQSIKEFTDNGVYEEISRGLRVLEEIGSSEESRRNRKVVHDYELSIRVNLSMVAGVALLGDTLSASRVFTRDEIVDQLANTVLYGRLRPQPANDHRAKQS